MANLIRFGITERNEVILSDHLVKPH